VCDRTGINAGFWWRNLKTKDHLQDPGWDGRILLIYILKNENSWAWFICVSTRRSGTLFWVLSVSWTAEGLLTSQKVLCFMEYIRFCYSSNNGGIIYDTPMLTSFHTQWNLSSTEPGNKGKLLQSRGLKLQIAVQKGTCLQRKIKCLSLAVLWQANFTACCCYFLSFKNLLNNSLSRFECCLQESLFLS